MGHRDARNLEWNAPLVLSGYNPGPANEARDAPNQGRQWLLENGYALAGSSYASLGWAIQDAVPDQLATLVAFTSKFGKPSRVIVWGESMGGLVTLALIEQHPDHFDGALPMCASVAGSVGMMNQALDAAFVLQTLSTPDVSSHGKPLAILSDRKEIRALLDQAQGTPEGRAHIAFAAVIAQIPEWNNPNKPEPQPEDLQAIEQGFYEAFPNGTFFPREDQERRAGGNASWNTGVDYGEELNRTGRRALVEQYYKLAGLDLKADLTKLSHSERIADDASAAAYLKKNYSPTGKLSKPVLTLHATNDGTTMATYEGAYARLVRDEGHAELLRNIFVKRAGHCNFSPGEVVTSLISLEDRVKAGTWDNLSGPALREKASELGIPDVQFVNFTPHASLRPCSLSEKKCQGEKGD